MKQMLISAEELLPGDNWTEHDGITYTVYANNPHIQDKFARTISVIAVGPDRIVIARYLDRQNDDKFLLNRPLI